MKKTLPALCIAVFCSCAYAQRPGAVPTRQEIDDAAYIKDNYTKIEKQAPMHYGAGTKLVVPAGRP